MCVVEDSKYCIVFTGGRKIDTGSDLIALPLLSTIGQMLLMYSSLMCLAPPHAE